jgi:hypothetical protein
MLLFDAGVNLPFAGVHLEFFRALVKAKQKGQGGLLGSPAFFTQFPKNLYRLLGCFSMDSGCSFGTSSSQGKSVK